VSAPWDLTPRPGAAPVARRVRAHAGLELRTQLRNGEQLLLTVVIPVGLLLFLTWVPLTDVATDPRVAFVAPGVLALAVMSTAFTGLAIQTGFERRYGVLKRLGSTPLTAGNLLAAKAVAVLVVEVGQVIVITAVALVLGWRPTPTAGSALVLLAVGTAAFAALGLLIAGTLRAEATLAVANLVYLVLLLLGGIVVPLRVFPPAVQSVLQWLPSAALADGLRQALGSGPDHGWPVQSLVVLVVWAVVAGIATARTFRFE
jgi:ABC-2 type transport system permease protein